MRLILFQFLIGTIQTLVDGLGMKVSDDVSIPHRYDPNRYQSS